MKETYSRYDPKIRKQLLFDAAYQIASTYPMGLHDLRLSAIAELANCAPSLFYHYYTCIADIRLRIIRKARRDKDNRILNQLLRG